MELRCLRRLALSLCVNVVVSVLRGRSFDDVVRRFDAAGKKRWRKVDDGRRERERETERESGGE